MLKPGNLISLEKYSIDIEKKAFQDGNGRVGRLIMFKFRNEKLCYENNPEQVREVHFVKEEKQLRYEYLKA